MPPHGSTLPVVPLAKEIGATLQTRVGLPGETVPEDGGSSSGAAQTSGSAAGQTGFMQYPRGVPITPDLIQAAGGSRVAAEVRPDPTATSAHMPQTGVSPARRLATPLAAADIGRQDVVSNTGGQGVVSNTGRQDVVSNIGRQNVAPVAGHHDVAPAVTAQALPLPAQPIRLHSGVDRYLRYQDTGRAQVPHGDAIVATPGRQILVQTTVGSGVANAAGIDPELASRSSLEQHARLGVSGTTDTPELDDLPFESIRVTVRESAGERPALGRAPTLELPAPRHPVGHPEWARSLGERLVVMVRGDHQTARLSLNPEHLGPVDIRLQITDEQARVWFTAQHPQAREALEAAVPRLRELFAQQGLDLSQHMSRDDGPRHHSDSGPARHGIGSYPSTDPDADISGDALDLASTSMRRGLVDHFA